MSADRPRRTMAKRQPAAPAVRPSEVTVAPVETPARSAAVASTAVASLTSPRLAEIQEQWAAARWTELSALSPADLETHPEGSRLALIAAAAALQSGDRLRALEHARLAVASGCDRRFASNLLLASARNVLGRASLAAGRSSQADEHFKLSLLEGRGSSQARRLAQRRADQVREDLARLVANNRHHTPGNVAQQSPEIPAWIDQLARQCASATDVHEAVDTALARALGTPQERVQLLMGVASAFERLGDSMTATHFLHHACEMASGTTAELRQGLARRLVALGQTESALDLLVADALSGLDTSQPQSLERPIRKAYSALREAEQARREHGHELLIAHLKAHLPDIRRQSGSRPLAMVEIGTTRENVPGQGSTRKLAEFCAANQIDFVTVDMDPHNAQMANELFSRMGVAYRAIAAKGEDYLAGRGDPVDFVFLDAYDFDHGKHSELRQSRYEKFLGSRIDEQACHRMHLECAQSLTRLLTPYGIVCVDDTWLENGHWTAKGTLAVPYLLAHGFELVEARNRAALLRRVATDGEPGAS